MPTILTDEQKNYVFMLLAGGMLPANEIRMFLARSGWSLDQIDAGVVYSQDEQLLSMLASLQPVAEPVVSQPAATSIVITNTVPGTVAADLTQVTSSVQAPQTAQPVADRYRESADTAEADFGKLVQSNPGLSTKIHEMRTSNMVVPSNMQMPQTASNVLVQNPVRTMPPGPKKSFARGILVFIAWFLLLVLVALVAGILGFMYYTGSGVFENIEYSKILPRI
jgi:hypothetical protein